VADGQDVAMVRAELFDIGGKLVSPRDPTTNTTITFSVASGPGRILATISGSPWDQPLDAPELDQTGASFPAHYGMLRAFVQTTRVCIGTADERALLKSIHVDAGLNGSSRVDGVGCAHSGSDVIVVKAEAKGLPVATIRIPVESDLAFSPLAVAADSALSHTVAVYI